MWGGGEGVLPFKGSVVMEMCGPSGYGLGDFVLNRVSSSSLILKQGIFSWQMS